MSVLFPLLREALDTFEIQQSSSIGRGFFVSTLRLRRDTCERLEVLFRKNRHWAGGRGELARYIRLLIDGNPYKIKLLVASLIVDKYFSQMFHRDGNTIGPILECIESAELQKKLENAEIPDMMKQLESFHKK